MFVLDNKIMMINTQLIITYIIISYQHLPPPTTDLHHPQTTKQLENKSPGQVLVKKIGTNNRDCLFWLKQQDEKESESEFVWCD